MAKLVNQEPGLLGVYGIGADMQELLCKESGDPHAAEAVDLFCCQARKFLGALAAVRGGLDTLIFTAGIGEHSAPMRKRICNGLGYLGIEADPHRNTAHPPIISRQGSLLLAGS